MSLVVASVNYDGIYRENASGGFDVPVDRYADPVWVQADPIRAASRALAETDVRNEDFSYVTDAAEEVTWSTSTRPTGR